MIRKITKIGLIMCMVGNIMVGPTTVIAKDNVNTQKIERSIFYPAASKYMLPEKYLEAIATIESDMNNNCYEKSSQATGIMQLLPDTARELGFDDINNKEQNIEAGAKYLRMLVDRYQKEDYFDQNGNILTPYEMAAIAYNWGPENLDAHIKRNGCVVIAKNSKYGIPYETYNYVMKLRKLYDINEYFN